MSRWLEPVDGIDYNWTVGAQVFGCILCIALAALEFSGVALQTQGEGQGYWIYCVFFFPMLVYQYLVRRNWLAQTQVKKDE